VRISATGFIKNDVKPDSGLMGEVKARLGDTAEVADKCEKIVKSGCNAVLEVVKVYEAINKKPKAA